MLQRSHIVDRAVFMSQRMGSCCCNTPRYTPVQTYCSGRTDVRMCDMNKNRWKCKGSSADALTCVSRNSTHKAATPTDLLAPRAPSLGRHHNVECGTPGTLYEEEYLARSEAPVAGDKTCFTQHPAHCKMSAVGVNFLDGAAGDERAPPLHRQRLDMWKCMFTAT